MNLSRISFVTALVSAGFWAAKAVAIGLAGGNDLSSLEGPLFVVGFAFHVVALVTLTLWWTRNRHVGVRALSLVGIIAATFLVISGFEWLLAAIEPADAGWVWVEVNLWIVAAVLLALTWSAVRGASQPTRKATPVASVG